MSCIPEIFEYFSFVFCFYSNEHQPIHEHVVSAESQSVYEIIIDNGNVVWGEDRGYDISRGRLIFRKDLI